MNPTLLALDTATEACSVALLHNGEITHFEELAQRSHTQRILPMVNDVLNQSGIGLNQVNAIVFGQGPGSFTGVRVGVGIAQGLALGANLPVIPVSNLMTMAQAAFVEYQAEMVITAIDARMNEVYFAVYQAQKVRCQNNDFLQWQPIIEEQVCSPEKVLEQLAKIDNVALEKAIRVGTGWKAYPLLEQSKFGKESEITLPKARYMLDIAQQKWADKQLKSALEIEPVYLRNEVTWQKLPNR